MEIRRTLLPHDLQYCLDGASECCGITAAADIAIRLYGEAERLDAILNGDQPENSGRHHWRNDLRHREIAIERYGAEIIAQLPGPRRTALVERGLLSLTNDVKEKAEWLASAHFEDATKGGCLRPFRDHVRLTRDMRPTPKTARRLRSFRAIRTYVTAECDDLPKQRQLFEILGSIPPGGPTTEADREAIFRDLDGQLDSHRRAVRQAIEDVKWRDRFLADQTIIETDRVMVRLKPGVRAKMHRERRETRRAVKRAALLAAAMLGASSVSAFARGEPVMLSGPELAISARLTGSISAKGHGALQIGIHEADGAKLAGLCVYQQAPALDQLVSLALHVSAGCINEVVATGNVYAVEPRADAHPVIAARVQHARPALEPVDEVVAISSRRPWGRYRDERELFDAARAAYAAEMRPVYEDIIATIVFGPAAKILRRNRELLG